MTSLNPVFDVPETELGAESGFSPDELRKRCELFVVQVVHWDYAINRVPPSHIGALLLRGTRDAMTEPFEQKNSPTGDSGPVRPILAPRAEFEGELLRLNRADATTIARSRGQW